MELLFLEHTKKATSVIFLPTLSSKNLISLMQFELGNSKKVTPLGVPLVAQWVVNPTSIHKDVGSIPGCGCSVGRQLQL